MKVAVIINYCSNDYVFLKPCIDAVRPFASEIIVPYCDHFVDGSEENHEVLVKSVAENDGVEFVEFSYEPTMNSRWHHNAARKVGITSVSTNPDYFLFLDTDEIVEADNFSKWLKLQQGNMLESYKLANYTYFRDVRYRCKTVEDSIILVHKELTTRDNLVFHPEERFGLWYYGFTKDRMCMLEGKPFIHHYSWVRTKETMLKKVTSWGHNKDKDWVSLVHKEFEEPFRGKDVIFGDGREYEIVEPYVDIKL